MTEAREARCSPAIHLNGREHAAAQRTPEAVLSGYQARSLCKEHCLLGGSDDSCGRLAHNEMRADEYFSGFFGKVGALDMPQQQFCGGASHLLFWDADGRERWMCVRCLTNIIYPNHREIMWY